MGGTPLYRWGQDLTSRLQQHPCRCAATRSGYVRCRGCSNSARWLVRNPKVLMLDEPTRGIDVGAKAEIQKLIDELAREQGMSILMISSELEEVIEGSDRVAVMKEGRKLGELAHDEASEDRVLAAISEG